MLSNLRGVIAHDQARHGRYMRINYAVSLHNLINPLCHRAVGSFCNGSCTSLPPLDLLGIHLPRLVPTLLLKESIIRFLLLVHLVDVDGCISELNILDVLLIDFGHFALIWTLLLLLTSLVVVFFARCLLRWSVVRRVLHAVRRLLFALCGLRFVCCTLPYACCVLVVLRCW